MKTKLLLASLAALAVVGLLLVKSRTPVATDRRAAETSSRPAVPVVSRQRAPAVSVAETPAEAEPFTNLYARPSPKPTAEQLAAYLEQNHRSAASLLAAARVSGDRALRREAMEKYPNDPRVAFDAYFLNGPYDSAKPADEERRKWLDTLKQSDSQNSLGDYLSARDHFKSGQTALALQELQAAAGKTTFEDYSLDFLQNTEEALHAAGYDAGVARVSASRDLLLPTLSELKQLGVSIVDLAKQYQQAGDSASAQSTLQTGLDLAGRPHGPGQVFLINNLVGFAIEKSVLNAMDPTGPFGPAGSTVQDELAAIEKQRAIIKDLNSRSTPLLLTAPDQEIVAFYDRVRLLGEQAAMQWLVDRHSQ